MLEKGKEPYFMANHAKKRKISKKWIVISVVSTGIVGVVIASILLIQNGLLETISGMFLHAPGSEITFSDPTALPNGSDSESSSDGEPEPLPDPVFAYPEEMKGAWLTPGVDYLTSDKDSGEQVKAQIDEAFVSLEEWGFNTVILPMGKGKRTVYPSSVLESITVINGDGSRFDPLAYILKKAEEQGIYTYGVLDFHVGDEDNWDPTLAEDAKKMLQMTEEAVGLYSFDGYLLSNYSFAIGSSGNEEAFAAQTVYDNIDAFTSAAITDMMKQAVETVKTANRNFYTGLLSRGIWAHQRVDERGSETDGSYEEMTDGHADTLSWVRDKMFDFVMIRNSNATTHPTAPFGKVLDWWNGVCAEAGVSLAVSLSADLVGGQERGWNAPDQLSQQLLLCREASQWGGCVFQSLTNLKQDTTGSTEALMKTYEGTIDSDHIFDTLKITYPKKATTTTNESKSSLQGNADPNFPLLLNGEPVELSEHGYFGVDVELQPGVNTYTFEHKGKKVVYKITYQVVVLQSVAPAADMNLEGGSVVVLGAVARKGASVTATINGQKISMKAAPIKDDENDSGEESEFVNYSGEYTLPDGKIGQEQNLGAVSVTASYNGLTETKKGGSITVNALPDSGTNLPETDLPGVIDGLKTLSPTLGTGEKVTSGPVVVVTSDYAETFEGSTTDDYSRPYNAYLPKGSTDAYVGIVTDASTGRQYYQTVSGRRVYTKDAALYKAEDFKANAISAQGKVSKSHTILTISAQWRIPFNVKQAPQKYYRDTTDREPHYSISNYGQTAEYVDITFYYVSAVEGTPDFSGSPLIQSAEWIKREGYTYILRLHLKNKGAFYGFSEVWDNEGNLQISFLNPASTSGGRLDGVRILLDPGHGGPTEKPAEAKLNLAYAFTLRDKLEALGAEVTMTRTADVVLELEDRPALAHNKGYHLIISVHMNGVTSAKATGASVHYYSEYGYTAGKFIYDRMHALEIQYGVGRHNPKNCEICKAAGVSQKPNTSPRSEGVAWGTLLMTRSIFDMPSVLIECAFQSNPTDMECLKNPEYQDKLMQAVTQGVTDYFGAMPSARAAASTQTAPVSCPEAAPVDFGTEYMIPARRRYI